MKFPTAPAGVRLSLLALALFLSGCPARQSPTVPETSPDAPPALNVDRSTGAFAQTDPWILTTKDPKASRGNHGVFIGNGYMGVTWGNKEPLQLRVAGVYEEPGERLAVLGMPQGSSSEQRLLVSTPAILLDMKRGVMNLALDTNVIEQDPAVVFTSLDNPHLLVVRRAEGPRTFDMITKDSDVVVEKTRVKGGVTVAVAEIVSDQETNYFAAVYTSRDTPDPATAAKKAVQAAHEVGYGGLLVRHEAAWAKRWAQGDITIDGDPEAQQMVHKALFDLMQSLPPGGGADSIAPETLSGDFYKGHIFWDAEVWMFPALLAQRPDLARSILEYRFQHLEQARAQAKAHGFAGADFPWESAASGKEVAPGGFSEGRHVTAGVGWAAWQYYRATGDTTWLQSRGWPLLSQIADFWTSRAKKNPKTGKWDILRVFGPDELKGMVDNNTYTNALVRDCLLAAGKAGRLVGAKANPQWAVVAQNLALPFDKAKGVYLTRQNDDGKSTKQADGELVLYPAELPMDLKTAQATFDFHKTRPIKNGPAMTASIHALLAARLGRSGEAEQFFRDSYRPFVRGPFLLFSEKRSLDRCVFTTGEGGLLQSVIYGFGGLDYSSPTGLIKGKPALPASWKKLTITGVRRGGKRYTLVVTSQGRTLTPEVAPSK